MITNVKALATKPRSILWLRRVLPPMLAFGCLFYLATIVLPDLERTRDLMTNVQLPPLLAAVTLNGLTVAILTAAWTDMMRRMPGAESISGRSHGMVYWYSNLAKRIPGFVWQYASRVYLYKRTEVAGRTTILGIVAEAVILMVSSAAVFAACHVVRRSSEWGPLTSAALAVAGAASGIAFLLALRRLRAREAPLHMRQASAYSRRWPAGATTIARWAVLWLPAYIMAWVLGGLMLFASATAVQPLSLEHLPTVVGAWALAGAASTAAFFIPGGLGIRELTLAHGLAAAMPASTAVTVAVLFRFVLVAGEAAWSLLFIAAARLMADKQSQTNKASSR